MSEPDPDLTAALMRSIQSRSASARPCRNADCQTARATIDRLTSELEQVRSLAKCWTCGGVPPASGLPCVCGGTNSHTEEVDGLRAIALGFTPQPRAFELSPPPPFANTRKHTPTNTQEDEG
jgi:hypothetical protein